MNCWLVEGLIGLGGELSIDEKGKKEDKESLEDRSIKECCRKRGQQGRIRRWYVDGRGERWLRQFNH